jgi:hypothetical protein
MPTTSASIATMTMKIITAITAITNAFSHPQSKKCLINASHTMNIITADIKLPTKNPTTAPIIVPERQQLCLQRFVLVMQLNPYRFSLFYYAFDFFLSLTHK